jgi:hypothetical protein
MHLPPTFISSLRVGFSACVIAVTSLTVGVVIGVLAIVPALSELTPSDASPRWDTSRFERLVLDVNAPDPRPYRTATPAYDMSTPPGYGAIARAKARGATERRAAPAARANKRLSRPQINKDAADAFALSAPPSPFADGSSHRRRDRHTIF